MLRGNGEGNGEGEGERKVRLVSFGSSLIIHEPPSYDQKNLAACSATIQRQTSK